MLYVTEQTAFVPGWAIIIPLLVITAVGVWLVLGDREPDPYNHVFNPCSVFGPVARCCEWVEDPATGLEVECGLDHTTHLAVYGA